jgi:2-polyprenylphenol 6-hydroxylase
MNAERQFEVLIAGGGLVGAALARSLAGLRVALVAQERRADPLPQGFDARVNAGFDARVNAGFGARVYAISPGNAAFLARLGAWAAIPARHLTPVHTMRVHGDDGASRIEFDAYRSGVSELAWIVEDRRLQEALRHALEGQEGLTHFSASSIRELEISPRQAGAILDDGRAPTAQLLVGADGARSQVRERAGIANEAQDYGQTAVVANFACTRPHRNVAFQWFHGPARGGAVLALLPLPGDHVSMVWSTTCADAVRLLALDPVALSREVADVTAHELGEFALVTPPRSFPLQRLAAARLVAPRVALVGDAAHVIHPLAGQGANLGLQDAQALAQVLAAREPGRDLGDERLLRRYERARAEGILAMQSTVHGLHRLFDAPGPALAKMRNAGLNLADRMPVLKNLLMRHAMG